MSYHDTSGRYQDNQGGSDQLTEIESVKVDRLGVHIMIEAVLALAFAGALFALYRSTGAALNTVDGRQAAVIVAVPLLIVAMAAALTFRAGIPNLSIGVIAFAAGAIFTMNSDQGLTTSLLITAGIVCAAGIAMAVIIVGLRVPGWAGTAAFGLGIYAWLHGLDSGREISIDGVGIFPMSQAWIWAIGVAVISIIGGIMGAGSGWRIRFGACRESAEPTVVRTGSTIATQTMAIVGSSLLAGTAGVWIVWAGADTDISGPIQAINPLLLTVIALGTAALGGTSLYGRRGGVLGTVLASLTTTTILLIAIVREWNFPFVAIPLAALVIGFVVTRLVEWLGSPEPSDPEPFLPEEPETPLYNEPTYGADVEQQRYPSYQDFPTQQQNYQDFR